MKLLGGLIGIILVIAIGSIVYLGLSDVNVPQETVTKPISLEKQ